MTSNQNYMDTFSWLFITLTSSITIAAGSSGVVIENLYPVVTTNSIILEAGAPVSSCIIKSVKKMG
jgi:hypothetical protein